MSLTEILARPQVAEQFSRYVRVPTGGVGGPSLVVPACGHQSYALVGTAFDYCLRFCLAAANPGRFVAGEWIAELGLRLLRQERGTPAGVSVELARKGVGRARALYDEFLASHVFTRPLARAALFLAALDRDYRDGPQAITPAHLTEQLEAEAEDVMRLVAGISPEMLQASTRVILNPSFGRVSTLFGGADADYLIDDTLVDIKTTRSCEVTPARLHQLVGYRMLLDLCRPGDAPVGEARGVTHGALYFSRHAALVKIRFDDVIDRSDNARLSRWLMEVVSRGSAACPQARAEIVGL